MECKRCGGSMMLETVIKLRRGFFVGFRETRSLGAYCATCQLGVPIETHQAAMYEPTWATARPRKDTRGSLPAWLRADASRSSYMHTGAISFQWRGRLGRLTAWMPS